MLLVINIQKKIGSSEMRTYVLIGINLASCAISSGFAVYLVSHRFTYLGYEHDTLRYRLQETMKDSSTGQSIIRVKYKESSTLVIVMSSVDSKKTDDIGPSLLPPEKAISEDIATTGYQKRFLKLIIVQAPIIAWSIYFVSTKMVLSKSSLEILNVKVEFLRKYEL